MKTKAINLVAVCLLTTFAILPMAQALVPKPDGGYPGFSTAEGDNALLNLDTGFAFGNTAVGWSALSNDVGASLNTAMGAGALLDNNGEQNTATGAVALLNNTAGAFNTADGAFALFSNHEGLGNVATGWYSLAQNTDGSQNTAVGSNALLDSAVGENNTAVGSNALAHSTGSENVALGFTAGNGVTTANNVICIGTGVAGADVSDSCFIGNIAGVEVTGDPVVVDANGQLGVAPAGSPFSASQLLEQERLIRELKMTVVRQQKQIEALTAGLQKVSAQLELAQGAPKTVSDNH